MTFYKNAPVVLIVSVSLFLLSGCDSNGGGKKEKFTDSDMYEFSKPKVVHLPEVLDEISGIVYYPKDTSIFAIVDEDGTLFKVKLNNPKNIQYWSFSKARDYEDLVLVDSVFFAMESDGDIFSIRFSGDSIISTKGNFPSIEKSEFESMFALGDSLLAIICKDCKTDPKDQISSYVYNHKDTTQSYQRYIQFKMEKVIEKAGLKDDFKASAAAINPITKEIYLVSSVSKMILITDSTGNFKEVYKLNPKIYKQPEGIAFTPDGDLIISNEFGEVGFPNLLLMKNKKKRAQWED